MSAGKITETNSGKGKKAFTKISLLFLTAWRSHTALITMRYKFYQITWRAEQEREFYYKDFNLSPVSFSHHR